MTLKWLALLCSTFIAITSYPQHVEKQKPPRLSSRKILKHYFPNPQLFLVMDSVRHQGKINAVTTPIETPEKLPYTGKGVVIGIVDVGYDLTHPAFFTPEGVCRIRRLWDQNANSGTPPARFGYGVEYRTETQITALERDVASGSHGTHVANIAAGSRTGSAYYGVASEAEIILVSTSLKNTEVLDGVKYIADYARETGKPCVINLSIGGRIGPHDGTSDFDRAIDSIVSRGLLVVGAAGNDGDKKYHASRLFTSEGETMQVVNISSGGICYADIWGETNSDFKLAAALTDRRTGETLFRQEEWVSAAQDTAYIDSVTFGKGVVVGIFTERDSVNHRPHAAAICFYPGKGDYLQFETRMVGKVGHEIHAWAGESSEFLQIDGSTVNTSSTMMEVGGTGRHTLSVGSFVSKTKSPSKETEFTMYAINPSSGKGPTLDGRMKPDVTAGGSLVVSAVSRFDGTFRSLSVDTVTRAGIDYYYAPNQGTSMASPVVAGVVALWLEANPELTVDEVRDILAHSSWKDERVDWTDIHTWGYGKIDAYAGLQYLLQHYPLSIQSLDRDEAEVHLLQTAEGPRLFFTHPAQQVRIVGYSPAGERLFTQFYPVMEAGDEGLLPIHPSSGIILVRVTTSHQSYTFKIHGAH